ncbi:MAG: 30S ribosomal protein S13 [Candidatus Micrarchaeota archaeon]
MAKEKESKAAEAKLKEKKVFKPPVQKQVSKMTGKESKEFKGIVRLAGKDLDGHLKVRSALTQIRGIGHNLSASLAIAVQSKLGVDPSMPVGELSEEKLEELETLVRNPGESVLPFLLNRQKDLETGTARHLLATELAFAVNQDIQRQKDSRSYIGWRHSLGQKVRGQHNRTTGRTGMTVGVLKKALKQAAAAAAAGEKKEEKK